MHILLDSTLTLVVECSLAASSQSGYVEMTYSTDRVQTFSSETSSVSCSSTSTVGNPSTLTVG